MEAAAEGEAGAEARAEAGAEVAEAAAAGSMNEAALLRALRDEGGVEVSGVSSFFDAAWRSLDEQARAQRRCGLLAASETVVDLVELLVGWLHAAHFLTADRVRAARLRALVASTVAQSVVEWGGASADVVRLREAWGRCVDALGQRPEGLELRLPAGRNGSTA